MLLTLTVSIQHAASTVGNVNNMAPKKLFSNGISLIVWWSVSLLQLIQCVSIDKVLVNDCITLSNGEGQEHAFYFDISSLSCAQCAQTNTIQTISNDGECF